MKKILFSMLALLAIATTARAQVTINTTNFPDANFRSFVSGKTIDEDQNGILSTTEIAAVREINVAAQDIGNLKGIEHFTALEVLKCYRNQLTSLDLSANTALEELTCNLNKLTSLNVSKNTKLTSLICTDNQLTKLDVSANTELTRLDCDGNQLAKLDISANTKLTNFSCHNNQLTTLDVSAHPELRQLYCGKNKLTELKISENNKELREIHCYSNQIKGDKMLALVNNLPTVSSRSFYVIDLKDSNEGNVITQSQVAVAKGKGWIVYDRNGGSRIEYAGSGAPVGSGIAISSANFPDANFRNWVLAQEYGKDGYLSDAEIAAVTSMDVSKKSIKNLKGIEYFTALKSLFCYQNQLSELDVSKNTKLQTLSCHMNKLTSLNVSGCTALATLYCYDNQLTELNVKDTRLTTLTCHSNKIKGDKMQALVESLPKVTDGKFWVINTKDTNEQNVITKSQVAVAKGKGWSVYDNNGGSGVVYDGVIAIDATNFPDANFRNWVLAQEYGKDGYLTDAEIAAVTTMNVSSKSIKNLKGIEYFTALQTLYCHKNQLTELDVSKNTNLSYLECGTNQLTKLDVSANTNLQTIWCNNNQLTALDVSKNKKLTALYCYVNQIKGDKMQALVNSLPTVSGSSGKFHVIDTKNSNEGNEITRPQVTVAKNKNWSVYDRNGTTPVEYEGSDTPTGLTAVESGQLTVDSWYTIDGKKLSGEPTKKGVYIVNGKKVVK